MTIRTKFPTVTTEGRAGGLSQIHLKNYTNFKKKEPFH